MKHVIPGYKTLKALKFLVTGPLIVLMLFVINQMTLGHHGQQWWHWAALGIGIAWVFSLLRVISTVVMVGGVSALAYWWLKRKNGAPL